MSNKQIAGRFLTLMSSTGLAKHEFARIAGLPLIAIQDYATGERMPTGSALIKIREAFNIDINWLLTGSALASKAPASYRLHWYCICIKGTSHGESITASVYASLSVNQITKSVIEQISIALRIEMSALLSASYLGEMTHDEFAGDEFDGDGHVAPLASCRQLENKFKIYQS